MLSEIPFALKKHMKCFDVWQRKFKLTFRFFLNLRKNYAPMISLSQLVRQFCSKASKNAEQQIRLLLMARFPQASIKVNDVSGGCGAMFDVFVEDFEFKGLTTLRQHKLVTNTLKDKIKEMHGLRIHTTIPEDTPISEPES